MDLRTPADLRALRMRLGLQESQLAELLELGLGPVDIRKIEGGRQLGMWQGHIDALMALDRAFLAALDAILDGPRPAVLVTYPSDELLAQHEPETAAALRFNSVHRMVLAVAQELLSADGPHVPMVELVPAPYAHWLEAEGLEPTPDAVTAWALARVDAFRKKNGSPTL